MPGGGPPPHIDMLAYFWSAVEGDDAQMAAFGFCVLYSNTKKVFHKDWPLGGGTIGGRSLFRIFICMYL